MKAHNTRLPGSFGVSCELRYRSQRLVVWRLVAMGPPISPRRALSASAIAHCNRQPTRETSSPGRKLGAVREVGGRLYITADHENEEQMFKPVIGRAHIAQTTYSDHSYPSGARRTSGRPMTQLMRPDDPDEMSGRALVDLV